MTEKTTRLRIVLTAALCIAALLTVAWTAIPSFRVGILNFWLRTTGKDTAPTITFAPEDADPPYSFALPKGYTLEEYSQNGPVIFSTYVCPERGTEATLMVSYLYGDSNSTSIDTEDLSAYEELTIADRTAIYTEKIYSDSGGGVTRGILIISDDPQGVFTIHGQGMTREELIKAAETLELEPIEWEPPLAILSAQF